MVGLSDARLTTVYYTVLLAMLGCTASSSTDTLLFGDELAMAPIVMGSRGEMLAFLVRHFASDHPPIQRVLHVFEFRDGLVSRRDVWLDGASAIAQLTES